MITDEKGPKISASSWVMRSKKFAGTTSRASSVALDVTAGPVNWEVAGFSSLLFDCSVGATGLIPCASTTVKASACLKKEEIGRASCRERGQIVAGVGTLREKRN